jgi:hypothetical protein
MSESLKRTCYEIMSTRKQPKKIKITRECHIKVEFPNGSELHIKADKGSRYCIIGSSDAPEYKDAHVILVDKDGKESVLW